MAMFGSIPLPNIDNHQFKDVMDYFQQLKQAQTQRDQFGEELAAKKPLMAAQTKEALGKAAKDNMIAALFRDAFPGKDNMDIDNGDENTMVLPNSSTGTYPEMTPYQLSPDEQLKQSQMKPGESMVVGAQPTPNVPSPHNVPQGTSSSRQKNALNMLHALGVLKETPGEEEQRNIQTAAANAKATNEAKRESKKEEEYLNAGDIVNQYSGNLEKIYNLLNSDPGVSGNIAGARTSLHTGTENQGTFKGATVPLIGKLAKDISSRGGAAVAGMAQAGKPGIWESHASNVGLVKNLIDESIKDFHNAKESYESMTGKEYPKKLPKFLQQFENKEGSEFVRFKAPDGSHTVRIPVDKADMFASDHKDFKRIK